MCVFPAPCSQTLIGRMAGSNTQPGLSGHDWCEPEKRVCEPRGREGPEHSSANAGLA